MQTFEQFMSGSTSNLNESVNLKPRPTRPSVPSLDELAALINAHDYFEGHAQTFQPLDMKVKNKDIYFIWYDNNEMEYYINKFSMKSGVSNVPEDDASDFKSAQKLLKSL